MNKFVKLIVIITLILILTLSFAKNFFSSKQEIIGCTTFQDFQKDSESLVSAKIFNDKYFESNNYGLYFAYDEVGNLKTDIEYSVNDYNDEETYSLVEYTSQFGLQGHIFSFFINKLNIPFWGIKLLCCILLAIVLTSICYIIYNKYNKLLGTIFYITLLLSPWVVAFARNLYWVEFTWFLPILLGLILSTNYDRKKFVVPLIFISIFIKCLCGYEYISTIMIMTVAFFIIDFFNTKDKNEKIKIVKTTIIVGIICILAFVMALVLHATLRGEGNIIEGIKDIYQNDILRRTIISSSENNFTGILKESVDASILETVYKYFNWNTNIILGIEGKYFKLMVTITIVILSYNILKKKNNCYRDLVMFSVFLGATFSWLILGKSHSYVHTHMNYVLWYFGFVQICIYIIVNFICKKIYEIGSNKEE